MFLCLDLDVRKLLVNSSHASQGIHRLVILFFQIHLWSQRLGIHTMACLDWPNFGVMNSFLEDQVFLFASLYAATVYLFIWRNIRFLVTLFERPFYAGNCLLVPAQQLLFHASLKFVRVCWLVSFIGAQL